MSATNLTPGTLPRGVLAAFWSAVNLRRNWQHPAAEAVYYAARTALLVAGYPEAQIDEQERREIETAERLDREDAERVAAKLALIEERAA